MPAQIPWKLSDLAAAEIATLAADGIICTPEEVLRLNWLAWQIETPSHRMELSRGRPVRVGRTWLWPLTLAAEGWWQRAQEHARREGHQIALLAFAMAHARDPDALDMVPPETGYKTADAWIRKQACRPSEVATAIGEVLAQEDTGPDVDDPKASGDGMTPGQMVAILVASAGGPPELWERQVAVGYLREQLAAVHAQRMAENGSSLRDSDMVAATRKLGLAVEEIRQARGGVKDV